MTLDDFLSALENLIEDRETSDDEPGEGNFSCEDCRACNHCRFCIGCDTCEDCTYCDECMDCTSCTQSKRCVSCEKVSYCDDSRDCQGSRYLTLCVACNDCVHCLACVGLRGAEFYVLNERRTRKEYFALLRQVQELMQTRMAAGWRPPGIGLASEVFDAVVANRDPALTAAPWLVDLREEEPEPEPEHELHAEPEYREPASPSPREPFDAGRQRPGREATPHAPRDAYARHEYARAPQHEDSADVISDWAREPPEFGSSYLGYADPGDEDRVRARSTDEPTRSQLGRARPRQDYGEDLGLDLSADLDAPDVPRRQDQQPTQPFTRRAERAPLADPLKDPLRDPLWAAPVARHDPRDLRDRRDPRELAVDDSDVLAARDARWEDTRERTAARTPRPAQDAKRQPKLADEHDAPAQRERVLSSPWDDQDEGKDNRGRPKPSRGSLRQAGRPKRPAPSPREATGTGAGAGTGSYRTGSAPERTGSAPARTGSAPARTSSEGTHTGGTGLRLGRKPKRRR